MDPLFGMLSKFRKSEVSTSSCCPSPSCPNLDDLPDDVGPSDEVPVENRPPGLEDDEAETFVSLDGSGDERLPDACSDPTPPECPEIESTTTTENLYPDLYTCPEYGYFTLTLPSEAEIFGQVAVRGPQRVSEPNRPRQMSRRRSEIPLAPNNGSPRRTRSGWRF